MQFYFQLLLEFQTIRTDTSLNATTNVITALRGKYPFHSKLHFNLAGGPLLAEEIIMDQEINLAARILIAVSDPDLRRVAVAGLRSSGFCVSAPTDAEAAMLLVQSFSPDVLIVDSRLLTPEGRPLFEQLRNSTEQYLLCIAGEDEHRARAAMLQSGADDAISTPLHIDELAARCNAMLRRPRQLQQRVENVSPASLVFGPKSGLMMKKRRPLASSSRYLSSSAVAPPKCAHVTNCLILSGDRAGSVTAMSLTYTCPTCAASSTRQHPAPK
jgi:CheY-like chemotaxis protein